MRAYIALCVVAACSIPDEKFKTPPDAPPAEVLSLLAGGIGQMGATDDTGSAARFYSPELVVADNNYAYIADSGNHNIRKVDLQSGAVTTLAGSTSGVSGCADGPATDARFNTPVGLALLEGKLYVTDNQNHRIRSVDPASGDVTTVAGPDAAACGVSCTCPPGFMDATGSAARFDAPDGIVSDGFKNLYITDDANFVVRKLVAQFGSVTTIAGQARVAGSSDGDALSATFVNPDGIATDSLGNLYIADGGNHTIRKYVPGTTPMVSTLAGLANAAGSVDGVGSDARFRGPYTLLVAGGTLYVSDWYNGTLRQIDLASAVVTTYIGVANDREVRLGTVPDVARLNGPSGMAVIADGRMLIVDDVDNVLLFVH
jgi:DNA-binding beta-propeller fold protein YncE